jgi:hypothetical protein
MNFGLLIVILMLKKKILILIFFIKNNWKYIPIFSYFFKIFILKF